VKQFVSVDTINFKFQANMSQIGLYILIIIATHLLPERLNASLNGDVE
jgi:hypothetical protein